MNCFLDLDRISLSQYKCDICENYFSSTETKDNHSCRRSTLDICDTVKVEPLNTLSDPDNTIYIKEEECTEEAGVFSHSSYADDRVSFREKMIEMHKNGYSISEIAGCLGMYFQTVWRWIRRWEKDMNLNDRAKSGRKRKTTPMTDKAIVNIARGNPFCNAVVIRDAMHLDVSTSTVVQRLREHGIHKRVSIIREKLSDHNMKERLSFAQMYGNYDLEYWSRVIFSNEKTFFLTPEGDVHCKMFGHNRHHRGKPNEWPRDGVSINCWGWMCLTGVGELTTIDGLFNTDQYLEILEEVMLPTVRSMAFPYPERFIFMQCTGTFHSTRRMKQFFEEHSRNFEVIECPSRCCDINPFDNLCGKIVNEWEARREEDSSSLLSHLRKVWEGLRRRPELCESYVTSMPKRLASVIENAGAWTNFYNMGI